MSLTFCANHHYDGGKNPHDRTRLFSQADNRDAMHKITKVRAVRLADMPQRLYLMTQNVICQHAPPTTQVKQQA